MLSISSSVYTFMMMNRSMTRDESMYPNPEEFRPERFLGEKRAQDPREFAFGSGRRSDSISV